jgi:ribosomal protein S18 acetylase RimI-like enzyme
MTLRRALAEDLPFILQQEHKFRDLGFVGGDDARTHERQLSDPDCLYLMIEASGAPAGYAILRGLASVNGSVELKRIVIAEPGQGLGRQALTAVINKVFREFRAHRFWLDVFEDNLRARHVYRSLGFVEEGVLRECIKRGETYRSLVVMSMLETEFASRQ